MLILIVHLPYFSSIGTKVIRGGRWKSLPLQKGDGIGSLFGKMARNSAQLIISWGGKHDKKGESIFRVQQYTVSHVVKINCLCLL